MLWLSRGCRCLHLGLTAGRCYIRGDGLPTFLGQGQKGGRREGKQAFILKVKSAMGGGKAKLGFCLVVAYELFVFENWTVKPKCHFLHWKRFGVVGLVDVQC